MLQLLCLPRLPLFRLCLPLWLLLLLLLLPPFLLLCRLLLLLLCLTLLRLWLPL